MKKLLFVAIVLCFLSPVALSANNVVISSVVEVENAERPIAKEEEILERLQEIQQMDFKNMSREEKRALKKELKEIKETAGLDNRISISVGALIIIILLVILIF